MKVALYFGMVIGVVLLAGSLSAIEEGASRADVVAELGEPDGLIAAGDYELLTYERGDVELRDGKVVKFKLMTPEELVVAKREEQIRRAEEERRRARERKQRYERGLEVKERMLSSPTYAEASGTRKVEILRNFHTRYPEVEIDELLMPAVEEKKREQAAAAEAARIARLEDQVGKAEQRAQQAEWRATEAEATAQNALRSSYYNRNYYPYRRNYYRPSGFGLSVGYDSPEIDIKYKSGYSQPYRTYKVRSYRSGSSMHQIAPKRIRSTSSTTRFNDGF